MATTMEAAPTQAATFAHPTGADDPEALDRGAQEDREAEREPGERKS
jgi:hypothetical protein